MTVRRHRVPKDGAPSRHAGLENGYMDLKLAGVHNATPPLRLRQP